MDSDSAVPPDAWTAASLSSIESVQRVSGASRGVAMASAVPSAALTDAALASKGSALRVIAECCCVTLVD